MNPMPRAGEHWEGVPTMDYYSWETYETVKHLTVARPTSHVSYVIPKGERILCRTKGEDDVELIWGDTDRVVLRSQFNAWLRGSWIVRVLPTVTVGVCQRETSLSTSTTPLEFDLEDLSFTEQ